MVDESNLFALVVSAINTADAISQDVRQKQSDRDVAGRIREAMKTWKGAAFNFRDWTPPKTGATKQ